MALPKKLLHKLEDYLHEHKPSNGGYAEITPDEIQQLRDIVNLLIGEKYEEDPDGDLPVAVEFVDRTRYTREGFMPLPHLHQLEGDVEKIASALRIAQFNVSIGQKQVGNVLQAFDRELFEAAKNSQPLKFGERVYVRNLGMDVDEFVKKTQDKVLAMLEEWNVSFEAVKEYESRFEIRSSMSKAISKQMDSNIDVGLRPGKEGNIVVSLTFMSILQSNGEPLTSNCESAKTNKAPRPIP